MDVISQIKKKKDSIHITKEIRGNYNDLHSSNTNVDAMGVPCDFSVEEDPDKVSCCHDEFRDEIYVVITVRPKGGIGLLTRPSCIKFDY